MSGLSRIKSILRRISRIKLSPATYDKSLKCPNMFLFYSPRLGQPALPFEYFKVQTLYFKKLNTCMFVSWTITWKESSVFSNSFYSTLIWSILTIGCMLSIHYISLNIHGFVHFCLCSSISCCNMPSHLYVPFQGDHSSYIPNLLFFPDHLGYDQTYSTFFTHFWFLIRSKCLPPNIFKKNVYLQFLQLAVNEVFTSTVNYTCLLQP